MTKAYKTYAYERKGKSYLAFCRGKSGVYFIYERKKLVYIGHSGSDLYKTITRHFQSWDDPRQVRAVYPQTKNYIVVIRYYSPQKAEREEKRLIAKFKPRDCTNKYVDVEPYKGNFRKSLDVIIEECPF